MPRNQTERKCELLFSRLNEDDNREALEARLKEIADYKNQENIVKILIDEPLAIEGEKNRKAIYDELLKNPHFTEIHIGPDEYDQAEKRFSLDFELALWLIQALDEMEGLETVILACVDLDSEVARVVSRALRRSRRLKAFHLVYVNATIGGDACDILVQAIMKLLRFRSSLKHLKIMICSLSEATYEAIAESLQLTHSSLEKLQIMSKFHESPQIGATLLNAIATNKTLKEFLMDSFEDDNDNVIGPSIARVLNENSTLRSLAVCGQLNGTPELGRNVGIDINSFAAPLALNRSLRLFELSNWSIGDQGMWSLCEAVMENDSIVTLGLDRCNFGVEGLKAIGGLLSHNTALRSISVASNGIDDDGVSYICEPLLETNDTLKTLDISGNDIGEKGIRKVLDTVKMNSAIVDTSLGDQASTAAEDELHLYLERNKGARSLLSASPPLPLSLWPHVFRKADRCRETRGGRTRAPDLLFHLVKAKADMFSSIPRSQTLKRKRRHRRRS